MTGYATPASGPSVGTSGSDTSGTVVSLSPIDRELLRDIRRGLNALLVLLADSYRAIEDPTTYRDSYLDDEETQK